MIYLLFIQNPQLDRSNLPTSYTSSRTIENVFLFGRGEFPGDVFGQPGEGRKDDSGAAAPRQSEHDS